jgi:hypothetical protein
MEQHINSYQGMNKDTAYDSIAPTFYIDALDIRITATNGESLGAFTNIKGNEFAFNIPLESDPPGAWTASYPVIIGYATIRTRLILFVADDSDTKGWIYDVQYDPADSSITSGPTLLYYSNELYFKKAWPIEALGRYESDCIQRVYWTDYNNFFRSLNIEDPNIATLPVGLIDIFPDVIFTQPLIKAVAGGGFLTGGTYQIAYKLITQDGKETLVSPPSNIVHIVSDTETSGSSYLYNGDETPVNTGKSISIQVDTTGYQNFDRIEFLSIYKSSSTAAPVVTSIEQITLDGTNVASIVYTGAEGSAYDVELFDFTTKNYQFKTPKTITQKDGSLVIANIKESQISVQDLLAPGETFDAKTRRYRYTGGTPLPPYTPGTPQNDLLNAFNVDYNSDAHWNNVWHGTKQYRYNSTGTRLGGEGPNISYTFHLEKYTLDTTPELYSTAGVTQVPNVPDSPGHDLNDGYGIYENTTYPNYASPFMSGLLRGYKRGETYRFGIVFYTKKGEATFVEYIGDIKFPDISEIDSVVNDSGTQYWPLSTDGSGNITYGYAMGIKFDVDFSSCLSLLNQVESYQIVRVKRETTDSRRISQGIIRNFYYNPILAPTNDFDLQVGGDNNVLHLYPYYPQETSPGTFARYDNGSFKVFGNNTVVPQFADYLRLGDYLNYYAPEVSYQKDDAIGTMTNIGANPCLLVTGALGVRSRETAVLDLSPIDLGGNTCEDNITKARKIFPVTYNSVQNIRKWEINQAFQMEDTSEYTQKVTPLFGGYYMRNYWCMDDYEDYSDPQVNPNKPQQGVNNDRPEFFKSGSSVAGKIGRILTDFFTGDPITSPPAVNYFNAPTQLAPLDSTTLTVVPTSDLGEYYPLVETIVPRLEVYGGYNLNSLESNKFIPASPIIDISETNPIVFGGDIFINMAVLNVGMVELDTTFYEANDLYRKNNPKTEVFPVESVLNLDLDYGANLRTKVKYEVTNSNDTIRDVFLRQETNNAEAPYAKVMDMYQYNFVYSQEKDDVGFFIQPQNLLNCGANDIRAYLSNVKINEETVDSWTKFGANNFYDIDDYGPINKIINWKDTVYFLQDKGVGTYTINRAAVTTTADGVPTQLGTGLGFGKHVYHSKVHGCIHQWAVDATEVGIYFFDAFHRKLFTITSAGEGGGNLSLPVSEVKGMHSWLQELPSGVFVRKENGGDNPILGSGVHITKDVINDEVLFTFLSKARVKALVNSTAYSIGDIVFHNSVYYYITNGFTTGTNPLTNNNLLSLNSRLATAKEVFNSDTVVYDELAQQFSSRYSATPSTWINNGNILLSPDILNPRKVYTSNIGDWGKFYDVEQTMEMSLVVNPNADINKVLRTLEFNSIVRDDNKVIDRTATITGFRIYNEVQDTGFVPFSPARFRRKFDKWRLKIPRDQNSVAKQGRLRSTYFIVTLYFDNADNKQLIMNRLMSYFDYQIF